MDKEEYLTAKQLAKGMGYSVQTIDSWRRKNLGPEWEKRGYRGVRYKLDSVMSFIEQNPGFDFDLKAATSV